MTDGPGSLARAYVEQAMKNLKPFFDSIEEARQPYTVLIEETQRLYRGLIEGFNLKFFQDMARRDHEAKQVETLNSFLEDQGWFAPPILDEDQRAALLEMVESKCAPDSVVRQLVEYCVTGVGRAIVEKAACNWAFSGRGTLLEEAFEAHEQGKYSLSIPVLLSQAEGAYIGLLVLGGASQEDRPGLFKGRVPKEIEKFSWDLYPADVVLHTHLRSFSRALSAQFVESVWTEEDLNSLRAKYAMGYLSRHGVMHGIDKDYGSLENGVKALFILDVIRALLDRLRIEDGE